LAIRYAILLGAALGALHPGAAFGQGRGEGRGESAATSSSAGPLPVGLELSFGTRFPLEIGIEGAVEVPFGFTAHLGLGWMPRFYRDAINDTLVSVGAYDDTDAALIAAAFEDALILSPTFGWRPPPVPALEIYAGYVLSFLGGAVTRAEAEALSDQDLRGTGVTEVPLSGKAHGFQLGFAYHAELRSHLAVRLSLAYFQIVGSDIGIDVDVNGAAAERVVERVETALDAYLGDLLTSYVKSPLFGASLVWRF
jgi:hypothetical protein